MKIWKRKSAETELSRARKRLSRLPAAEVYNWAEALLGQAGRGFATWRRGGGEESLLDTEQVLLALVEVCQELIQRERARL